MNKAISITSNKLNLSGVLHLPEKVQHRKVPLKAIRSYGEAALIIHAKADEDIPKEHTARYCASLQLRPIHEIVNTHYIEGADHTFSSYTYENELFQTSVEWLEKCKEYPRKIAL